MPTLFELLPPELAARAVAWSARWGVSRLAVEVSLEFSPHMSRRLGSAAPERGAVRLADWLRASPPLLAEVLCHELAHVAAHRLHGATIRPHGREWRRLMADAGFAPRACLALPPGLRPPRRTRRAAERRLYVHRCPACGARRIAASVRRRWRCAACLAAGGSGALVVEPVDRMAPEDR